MDSALSQAFAHGLGGRSIPAAELLRCVSWVEERLAEARKQWPDVGLAPTTFATHVATCVETDAPYEELTKAKGLDLYLACACAQGDNTAIRQFEAAHAEVVRGTFARYKNSPLSFDEFSQELRERLFIGSPPAIAGFRGRGSSRAWVRVAATRLLLNSIQRGPQKSEIAVTRDQLFAVADAMDSGNGATGDRYQGAFARAFEQALATIGERERNLLRDRYVRAIPLAELATSYGLHRVTVSKLIAKTLQDVFAATRQRLQAELSLDVESADEVIGLLRSRLDLSLSRMLPDS